MQVVTRYLDANDNDRPDPGEPRVSQQPDGSFPELEVVGRFDTNGNGIYDGNEGQIQTQAAPDDENRLTLSELRRDFQLSELFSSELEANANLGLQLVTSANGSSALPSFLLDLNVDWDGFSFKDGTFEEPQAPEVSFDNVKIDLGSFASNFAGPILDRVNDVVEPVRPFVDFLQQDISFFSTLGINSLFGKQIDQNGDGQQSLVELISILPQSTINVAPFINEIDRISELLDLFDTISDTEGNNTLELGSYVIGLPNSIAGFSNPNLENFSLSSRTNRFNFSLPNFSLDDFSLGLTDLFDESADVNLSLPSNLSLDNFSGGLKKLFSQSGLRSTLNFDWSDLSLEDFVNQFNISGNTDLSLGSIVGSSGTTLRDFATGLSALLGSTDSDVSPDWSQFTLEDFAIGLQAVLEGKAGRIAENLDLGNISLRDFTNQFEPLFATGNFNLGSLGDIGAANFSLPKLRAPEIETQIETSTRGSTKELLDTIKGGTLEFPILTDPSVAIDLLLGKTDVNLFTYDIPPLELGAGFEANFIVFAPPTVRLGFGGDVSVGADFAFGFDTQGLFEWSQQDFALDKSFLALDGFFLSDRENPDGTGEDVNEITAALGLNVELGVGLNLGVASLEGFARGGLLGELGIDFRDTGESTGTSDGKIRAISEIGANITQPWQLFNLQGALTASAHIGIRAEVGGLFSRDLFRKDFGPFTLVEFEYGENGFTISTVFDGPIAGGTVFFDANFDGLQNPAEPFTLSQIDGSYELAIPLEIYDSNGNGQIDLSEGQVVVTGGVDVDTFQDQHFDFVSSPQWEVASPLTLLAMRLEEPEPLEVEAQIETAFGLPANFNLLEDRPVDGIIAGDSDAAAVFRTQAQLQNLLILGSNTLGEEDDRQSAAEALIQEIVKRVRSGESLDLTDADRLQSIIDNAATALGVTPTDFETAFDELVFLNGEIAQISGSGDSARAAIAELIPYEIVDDSYLHILENPWVSLLRAAVPEPDTETAIETVQDAIGLPNNLEIGRYNPIDEIDNGSALGLEIYAKQVQLNATWTQLAEISIGLGVEDAENVVIDRFVAALAAGEVYDNLGDEAQVSQLLATTVPGLDSERAAAAVRVIADRNREIDDLVAAAQAGGDLSDGRLRIAAEQRLAQGLQATLLQSMVLGEITVAQLDELIEYNIANDTPIVIENTIDGTENDDTLIGDDRNDAIIGFAGNDLIQGNGGNDLMFGNQDNDSIEGGDGHDIIAGGRDDDLLIGGAGFDVMFGNKGNDLLLGGEDEDFLYGGQDNDILRGEAGDDDLLGEKGDDLVEGGEGNDLIAGGEGVDTLQGNGGDDFIFGNTENDLIDGGEGNDTIAAGKDDDAVSGGLGDDWLFGNIGNDALDGGDGNDTIAGGKDDDWLQGNLGDDVLFGNLGNDLLYGANGDDTLAAGKDDDFAAGELGDDEVFGNIGNDTVDGGDGNDYLAGGQDNDILLGGLGEDTLSGDLGDDSLTGGGDSDRFALALDSGNDIITDFTDGVDFLAVSPDLLTELQQRPAIAVDVAEGAQIELGSGSVLLLGISAGAIEPSDFVSLL